MIRIIKCKRNSKNLPYWLAYELTIKGMSNNYHPVQLREDLIEELCSNDFDIVKVYHKHMKDRVI